MQQGSEDRGEQAEHRLEDAVKTRTPVPVGDGEFAAVFYVVKEKVFHFAVYPLVINEQIGLEVVFKTAEIEVY